MLHPYWEYFALISQLATRLVIGEVGANGLRPYAEYDNAISRLRRYLAGG